MNNIFLNKLYLENYKLFIKETLTFEDGLNIFDGPNGYGKTSVFDAIEFVITGTIKRITDNKAINGSLKYNHIFLANDSRKDTIIKSEFHLIDAFGDSRKIVIAKKIPGVSTTVSSVDRNPKKLTEITQTYLLPSFDTEELRDDYLIPSDQLASKHVEWFGSTSQSMYTMLYYVQQEDRLEFFKTTEKERVGSIDVLFQINDEKIKQREIAQAQKKLKNTIIKGLDEKINTLSANLSAGVSLSTLN
ncbi:MAG TPA: ATP-binding protein, partial [Clostridia bacterium]|nr:ATP-binding protein [Clostridia bacterium]